MTDTLPLLAETGLPAARNEAQAPLSPAAADVARGVNRLLLAEGFCPLLEFTLPNTRRLDVAALGVNGAVAGVEIKVSVQDLKADDKWPDYLRFCDFFYFAVPPAFPQNLLPAHTGLIVADRYGGTILRAAPRMALSPARRRAVTLGFAQCAALRLARRTDPYCG